MSEEGAGGSWQAKRGFVRVSGIGSFRTIWLAYPVSRDGSVMFGVC